MWKVFQGDRHGRKKPSKLSVDAVDWQASAGRLEKRVKALEAELRDQQKLVHEKEKAGEELSSQLVRVRTQLDQANAWKDKEEANSGKERARERVLLDDLQKTRDALDNESVLRIRLEGDLKQLRREKEDLAAAGRGLTSQVADLQRRLDSALKESRQLREENSKLHRKNEGTEWVSKADYRKLEELLKAERKKGSSNGI